MSAVLEHANLTVREPNETAEWMEKVFGWRIRWQGPALQGGYTVHVGEKDSYLALYTPAGDLSDPHPRYRNAGSLNHLAVVVNDIKATEAAVKEQGFVPMNHGDYEPGERFYFLDDNEVEYEVVSYA